MAAKSQSTMFVSTDESYKRLFDEIKSEMLKFDPVAFAENYLKIGGKPFKISGGGWKHMADIYRYIAVKAINPDGKPVVIVKGRQVGATVMAGALDLYFTASGLFGGDSPISVLHAFPALRLSQAFSQSKLSDLIDSSTNDYINQQKLGYNPRTKRVSSGKPDNMTLKQFKGGCNLWVESIGGDGDRIRGMSCDAIFIDEIQDTNPKAIGVALETLTQSKYGPPGKGIQVYFGTPKNKGSHFESLWHQTDKRYYFLGCTNKECGHYFMLYTPGNDEWEKIWLYDQRVQCPQCKHEEDKRVLIENGKWIATEPFDKDGKEKQYVGFHISKLYVPTLNKKYFIGQKPENNPLTSERLYHNETLGEFYSGVDMPITRDEIYEKCRDANRGFAQFIRPGERKSWMGMDWGGKIDMDNSNAGQSYSCAVVISADHSGILNIEFAYKLRSGDLNYKMDFVKEMFRNYGLSLVVADYGFGHHECNEMQKIYGNKFISALTSGNMRKNIVYDKDITQIKWNKDYFIEEMFDLMRAGKVRFPWKSYEYMDWLIEHVTSMEIDYTMANGIQKKTYKKGPTPNDGFMALIYAYLAYKFEVSKGFSFNPNNPHQSGAPSIALAYLPKIR